MKAYHFLNSSSICAISLNLMGFCKSEWYFNFVISELSILSVKAVFSIMAKFRDTWPLSYLWFIFDVAWIPSSTGISMSIKTKWYWFIGAKTAFSVTLFSAIYPSYASSILQLICDLISCLRAMMLYITSSTIRMLRKTDALDWVSCVGMV